MGKTELTKDTLFETLIGMSEGNPERQEDIRRLQNGLPVKVHGRRQKRLKTWKDLISVYRNKR